MSEMSMLDVTARFCSDLKFKRQQRNKIHGLIFGADSIKSFQAGTKSQTRRVRGLEWVNENPDKWVKASQINYDIWGKPSDRTWLFESFNTDLFVRCPYAVGDYLYSKETHCIVNPAGSRYVFYKADNNITGIKWRSPIFQRRADARFWFRITHIGADRLWDITLDDCVAEGIKINGWDEQWDLDIDAIRNSARAEYFRLWDALNPALPSSGNPWLWAYTVERCEAQ